MVNEEEEAAAEADRTVEPRWKKRLDHPIQTGVEPIKLRGIKIKVKRRRNKKINVKKRKTFLTL